MSGRERVETVRSPRTEALNFVTSGGKNKLSVNQWLDAGPPSGGKPEVSFCTGIPDTENGGTKFGNAKTGVAGRVVETGQSFTVRDDFDFKNPGPDGKGYHVNAQLGKETVAFRSGSNAPAAYHDRTNMTGERYAFDGPEQAAEWYTEGHSK